MNYFIGLVLCMCLFFSCQSNEQHEFRPDVSVQKIQLKNAANVHLVFGDDITERLLGYQVLKASILSNNQREKLTIYHYPEDDSLQFSKFEVKMNHLLDEVTPISSFPKFRTENGIEIGMKKEQVEKIKGRPDEKTNDMVETWIYRVDHSRLPKFLNHFHENQYEATYVFMKDHLVEYSFGFKK